MGPAAEVSTVKRLNRWTVDDLPSARSRTSWLVRPVSPFPELLIRVLCVLECLCSFLWGLLLRCRLHLLHCPQIFLSIYDQSSLRAPSLRGPLAAFRSARLASSSFLLSSRFFLFSSALLRPGRWRQRGTLHLHTAESWDETDLLTGVWHLW